MPNNKILFFKLIANEISYTLKGYPRLIEIGYLTGFGEKNCYGFGMAEVVNK
ncbi:MAG: CRISPR-associated endoribonuclease Cas6 [bacterium]